MGYHRAGFEVVGVDYHPQPRYPFRFIQADALCYAIAFGGRFNVIHASPPCQKYSKASHIHAYLIPTYKDMIPLTRKVLKFIGKPYIIENVPSAPLIDPIRLQGNLFDLKVIRERLFETTFIIEQPEIPPLPPGTTTNSYRGYSSFTNGATHITVGGHNYCFKDGKTAMGIDWMKQPELNQAIPPVYTEWLGKEAIIQL